MAKRVKTKRKLAKKKNTGELKFSYILIAMLLGLVLAIWLYIKLH